MSGGGCAEDLYQEEGMVQVARPVKFCKNL